MLPTSAAVHHPSQDPLPFRRSAGLFRPMRVCAILRGPRDQVRGRRFDGGRGTSDLPDEGIHRRAVPGRRSGETFVTENPATGQADRDDRSGRRGRHRCRGPGRAPGIRRRALVATRPGRAQGGPPPLRRPARGEPRGARAARLARGAASRSPTRREVDLPDAVRTFRWFAEAIDKVFDAVAPTGPDALGLIVREPIGVVGAVVPWNFPLADGDLEGRAGARRRQQPDRQARPADLAVARSGWPSSRRRPGCRTASSTSCRGSGCDGRPGARPAHGRRHGDVHRLDRGRPPVPALLRGEQPQGGRARVRRQEPAGRAGRPARPRPRRRAGPARRAHEHGRELLGRLAPDRPPLGPRRRWSSASSRASRRGRSATRWTPRPGSAR